MSICQNCKGLGALEDEFVKRVCPFCGGTGKETEEVAAATKPASGLWRNNPATREGKYLVKRRDGTVPGWPSFVLGAKDPAAPAALRAYAFEAQRLGMNAQYCSEVFDLASHFERYASQHGLGDPDRGPHRQDDPATVAEMRRGGNA